MSTKIRRKNTSVITAVLKHADRFSFTQIVRLLQRASVFRSKAARNQDKNKAATHSVGHFSPPAKEAVRFSHNPSLAFPGSEVNKVEQGSGISTQWKVTTNILGLTGSMGVLPYHYSELVLQRNKQRDRALISYLDIFNHRLISLFYQASTKYRLPYTYEAHALTRNQLTSNQSNVDKQTFALLSLIGLGGDHLQNRMLIRDESLIYYGGLLSQQVRTAQNLKQIISDYFSVPVNIEEFIGQWQELIDDVRSRLPWDRHPLGQNASLGKNSMLGKRGWFAQGKIRIRIGPLSQQQHQQFAPGSASTQTLNELVRLYLGMEREYEFEMLVNRKDISDRVALTKDQPPIMGWSTWLSGANDSKEPDNQLVKISVSAH